METSQSDAAVRTVSASEFQDRCLSLIDEVVQTGDELIITQDGRPISRVSPYRTRRDGWFGFNAGRITVYEDIVAPMPDEWFDESPTDPMNDL